MARCPDCNKFVSYDEDYEPEVSDEAVNIDGEGEDATATITATIRIALPCAECSTELAETSLDWEYEITAQDHTHTATPTDCEHCEGSGYMMDGVPAQEEDDNAEECGYCDGTGHQPMVDDGTDLYEIERVDATAAVRYNTVDRKGKPIKRSRYQAKYYGADLEADITCNFCDTTFTVTDNVEEQASAMESMV